MICLAMLRLTIRDFSAFQQFAAIHIHALYYFLLHSDRTVTLNIQIVLLFDMYLFKYITNKYLLTHPALFVSFFTILIELQFIIHVSICLIWLMNCFEVLISQCNNVWTYQISVNWRIHNKALYYAEWIVMTIIVMTTT